ncbi:hypothetical protein MB901379_02675 [Mycobacterium basiliense]|uniref:Uncharacterized protein n=1 Tax=Mycobacterium basiliense TaxID=2094119 RepID=A0A3S5CZU2_9MYCO|nr:hypothetical protein MB901379_02675 [Mycobacterium basiliense]
MPTGLFLASKFAEYVRCSKWQKWANVFGSDAAEFTSRYFCRAFRQTVGETTTSWFPHCAHPPECSRGKPMWRASQTPLPAGILTTAGAMW